MIKNKSGFFPVLILMLICIMCIAMCGRFSFFSRYEYSGDIDFGKYKWLKEKKIFLDPGHGGKGKSDRFRTANGITEEEVNLRVALFLKSMLERAGAVVSISRENDKDVPLDDRVEMVNKIIPDLLISLHHNGSIRRVDNVNYPVVFIWGNRKVRPLSYSFADILLDEFHRFMDEKGIVISDFSVYKETGTMILRETRYTCPGVIGEPGFFSDPDYAIKLKDFQYNQEEAEAYFYAIARFFKRGIPEAEVLVSSPIDNESSFYNFLKSDEPIIAIRTYSGRDNFGINNNSVSATLDGIAVKCRYMAEDLFFIDYGSKLYPGGHSLKFSFRNALQQSSMVYSAGFAVEIKKGDYDKLASDGIRLLNNKRKRKEGLRMLLAAYSMSTTDPDADRIIWNIARGFKLIGDKANSEYYYAKLYNFYPQSKYAKMLEYRFKDYRFPVEYNGKPVTIKYEPSLNMKTYKL